LDTVQRKLVRLQTERDALAHQGGKVRQRLAALDRRITEVVAQAERLRRAQAAQEGLSELFTLPGTVEPEGEPSDSAWPDDTSAFLIAAGPGEEVPLTRWRGVSAGLALVEGMLPEPERMGIEFLHEFREEWTERERDAFAMGLQIGVRLADALDSRFSSQRGVTDDSSSPESRADTDEE
jgi:hypothetical protein